MNPVQAPSAVTVTSLSTAPVSALQTLDGVPRSLRVPAALRLVPQREGWLRVRSGQVWLTASGDPSDHVLAEGEATWLAAGAQVVVEPWRAGEAALLAWDRADGVPARPAQRLAAPRGVLPVDRPADRFAAALRAGFTAFAAAWRSAAPSASRAHGCISAGDSIASSGACQ